MKNICVKQRDIKDCGAACLQSIIRYYDGYVSLEKIRQDTCITKDGITAYNIVIAAQKYGFDAYGIKINIDDLFSKKIILPCIAYLVLNNGLKHYVVIYKINKEFLLLMDPAKGMTKIKHNDFIKIWQNVIIVLTPKCPIIKFNQTNRLFDLFKKICHQEKKLIINLLIVSIILTILSIVSSFYFKISIKTISTNNYDYLWLIIIFFAILTIIKIFINYLRSYYENYLNKNIDVKIFIPFLKHIFKLPLKAISNRNTGEIATRINELNNIKNLFSNLFVSLILYLFMALSSLFFLYYLNYQLSIMLLTIIVIYISVNLLFIKPLMAKTNQNISFETSFNSMVISYLAAFNSIKNINQLNYFTNKLENNCCSYINDTFNFNNYLNRFMFLNNVIMDLGLFIVNTFGILMIYKNNLSLIDLVTFDSLYLYLLDPIKQIINLIPKYIYIKNTFTKINDFISLDEEESNIINNEIFINGDIDFSNISFSYNYYNYPLNKFSLHIEKGSKVLIMGSSGCGKSTLFKLLYRLYDPFSGRIAINNINIQDYSLNTIRNAITYVSQDEKLFNDTIKNNLTLGKTVSVDILNNIANICQINSILDAKSLRFDSVILESADNLSGGEKARLILARSLINSKPIIILDEAFSQIEEQDANIIINNIIDYFKENTIIIISHFKPAYNFNQVIRMGVLNE
jgi:ABC-type bacteriocin/lantibiotic exporter with double-glycine peptidase domain